MRMLKGASFSTVVLCSSLAFSLPTGEHVIHEKRDSIPEHWTKISEANDNTPIVLRFALTESNLECAEEYMRDVINTFAPSEGALSNTVEWLLQMGVASNRIVPSPGRNWIKVNSTVAEAGKLLGTTYSVYQDDEGTFLHIDFVSPTIQFDPRMGTIARRTTKREAMRLKSKVIEIDSEPLELDSCTQLTTPACLREIYGIPEQGEAVEGKSYGIVEFAPQSYNQVDLNGFFTTKLVNETGSRTRGESNLYLCYAMALVHPQNITLYPVGDDVVWNPATNNNFLDTIDGSYCTFGGGDDPTWDAMCGMYEATNVISVSYGCNEGDRPLSYTARECNEYMELGLMGVTLLFSGDTGVAGLSGRCLLDNGAPTPVGSDYGRSNPLFPASCPWITSVGGSALPANGSVGDREVAATVASYYVEHDPGYNSSRYNNSQTVRGFPDVAVASQDCRVLS
ncbi:peptidase S8/S53 domain-containing protein [Xylaria sp. FL1042]|nr:peptidase S8/S53 domain-containing protein [Xylaria sp. FL1042]